MKTYMKNSKLKIAWITLVTLLVATIIYPLSQFVIMIKVGLNTNTYLNIPELASFNVRVIVPYLAVIAGILVSTILFPKTLKYTTKKQTAVSSFIAIAVFLIVEPIVEYVVASKAYTSNLMTMRRYIPPDKVAEFFSIPMVVRIHYYIFSLIIICLFFTFTSSLFAYLSDITNKYSRRKVFIMGVATAIYTFLYAFVGIIMYENYSIHIVDTKSAISTVSCIMVAAVAAGLFLNEIIPRSKIIPLVSSSIVVIILYIAEALMLDGSLYRYGQGWIFDSLPFVPFSIANILVVLLPAIITYCLSKKLNYQEV